MKTWNVALVTLVLATTVAGQTGNVSIAGDVSKPIVLSTTELEKLPQETATVSLEGQKVTFSGPSVHAVLGLAGVMFDDASRPLNRTRYVVVTGADGFVAVYGMLEFDPGVGAASALVALSRDGKPLSGAEGPFRLITTGDKRPTRWVRQTVRVGVGRDAP